MGEKNLYLPLRNKVRSGEVIKVPKARYDLVKVQSSLANADSPGETMGLWWLSIFPNARNS